MLDILSSRKAYDLNRYRTTEGFNKKAIERDTAALVIESHGEIHSFFLAVLSNENVVNPTLSKTDDVSRFYASDSPQIERESAAGLKVRKALTEEPANTLIAWVSPPGGEFNYSEGRLEIGRVRNILGYKVLQSYGIPLKKISPERCEAMFLLLEEFSTKPANNINCPEDLRDRIVIFNSPNNSNWLDFLKHTFPELASKFEEIQSGKVLHIQLQALKDAKTEVSKAFKDSVVEDENLIFIGAQIEEGLLSRGWNLSGETCGFLNSDILRMRQKAMFGTISVKEKKAQFVKECPFCHKKYDKVLKPGFICSCGQTFEGLCN